MADAKNQVIHTSSTKWLNKPIGNDHLCISLSLLNTFKQINNPSESLVDRSTVMTDVRGFIHCLNEELNR
jgi:hypothetical protein